MPDWLPTAVIYAVAVLSPLSAALQWIARLRWSDEYRASVEARIAAQDQVIKAKEAQIGTLEQTLKAKDVNIEMYKAMSYSDALKELNAQKQIFEGRIAAQQKELSALATQLKVTVIELSKVSAEPTESWLTTLQEGAALTRQAAGTLSDYRDAVARLNARDDPQAAVMRGSLQAMEEANRIAARGGPDYPPMRFHSPTIPPDTTAATNLDYEVT